MKGITFFKIFKTLFCIFIFIGFLCIRHVSIADAAVEVVEEITYNSTTDQYTYEYTLTNSGDIPIYWWGIFYEEDPNAYFTGSEEKNASVHCDDNWRNNGLDLLGGFMPYNPTTGSGTGYLSTSAIGFASGNAQEVGWSDGDAWITDTTYQALPSLEQDAYDPATIGGPYGWTGDGANVQTNYGIGEDEQGTYTMVSDDEEKFDGDKTFFYNTTNWWDGWIVDDGIETDDSDDTIVNGAFEYYGTTDEYVAPSGGGGTSWGWPTFAQGFLTGFGGFAPQQWYQAPSFAPSFQQQWYQAPSFQQQLFQFQPFQQQQWYQPFQQQWFQPFQQQQQWQQWQQPQFWASQQWQWGGRW